MNAIKLSKVSKKYNSKVITDNLDLSVKVGELVVILGKSGCGKTTLIKMICGIIKPDSGKIEITSSAHKNYAIGYVPQSPSLLRSKNIIDNILLPLKLVSSKTDNYPPKPLLKLLSLNGFEKQYPHQLSRGQQQRVSLARAMILRPSVLVMDEPFASIDEISKEALDLELLKLRNNSNVSIIIVTHSVEEAIFLADKIIVMGEGCIAGSVNINFGEDLRTPKIKATQKYFEYQKQVRRLL
jgi:ABC-type nitrate/sulfonate/bicarbonate transport system ATPase subunit